MASYTRLTKKCPHCNYPYKELEYRSGTRLDVTVEFGEIFITCKKCKKLFRDQGCYELAVMEPPSGYLSRITFATIFGVILTAFWVYIFFNTSFFSTIKDVTFWHILGFGYLVLLGPYAIIADILRYRRHKATVEKETEVSKRRLKRNPEYVRMLIASGYTIPQDCMPEQIKQP